MMEVLQIEFSFKNHMQNFLRELDDSWVRYYISTRVNPNQMEVVVEVEPGIAPIVAFEQVHSIANQCYGSAKYI